MMTEKQLWNAYLSTLTDEQAFAMRYTAWHFDDNETSANALAELVLLGEKRATASSLWVYEKESAPLP
ncbi:hypothetical protein ACFSTH_05540 [Paenibacillus yanchengensis]|uniref:Uncharacterized protein n=1 Tax=Paenibacillus yanchengensis TaxID=2035833 RepID=A0ABW4YHP5_9BACL